MRPPVLPLRAGALLLLTLLLPLVTGCDDADPNPPPAGGASAFVGTVAGAQTSGAITITVDGADATGTLALVGSAARAASSDLSGSYDPDTGALHLEGGGYTFDGTLSGGVLSGTWTGPGGTSGTFVAYLDGEGAVVEVYCGSYDTENEDGTFNLVRNDASLRGFAVSTQGEAIDLSGSVSGNTITIWATEAGPSANVASGTFSSDGSSFSGTVNDPDNPGTFSGSRCTP